MISDRAGEKNCFVVHWSIKNFNYFSPEFHGHGIETLVFHVHNLTEGGLFLSLIPTGEDGEHLTLNLNAFCKDSHFAIDCEWSFLDCGGFPLIESTTYNQFLKCGESFSMPNCPTLEEMCVTRRSEFLSKDTLTVQLRIWKSRGYMPYPEIILARSGIELNEKSFLWTVDGFSDLHLHQNVACPFPVQYQKTYFSHPTTLRWELSLTGESLENSSVDLKVTSSEVQVTCPVTFKLYILDKQQDLTNYMECKHIFSKGQLIYSVPKFTSRRELLEKKADCLHDDVLTIFCEIININSNIFKSIGKSHCGPLFMRKNIKSKVMDDSLDRIGMFEHPMSVLRDDLLSMYRDQTMSDFKLRCGEISLRVHKNVLSVRSPVFKEIISGLKSDSESMEVTDLDLHTLNRMLTFLYTGTLEPDLRLGDATKLYSAAYKYHVWSLKDECSAVLRSSVSVSNVSDILILADQHQDKDIKLFMIDFILSHFEEVAHSTEWERFLESDHSFQGEIMHQLYKLKLQNSR